MRSTWASLGGAGIVLVVGLTLVAGVNHRIELDTDDAYITYRYARNLAEGNGFAYNPGERVLGTTTPLFTLLLAGAGRLGIAIPQASAVLNLAAGALVGAVICLWVARLTGRTVLGLAASALLLSHPKFVLFAVSGMETGLYLLLIVLAFWLYDLERFAGAALCAALVFLVRFDGAAVGAVLLAHHLLTRRAWPGSRVWAAFLVPVIPWCIFALLYFGGVLPQSMLAKHAHGLVAGRWWMVEFVLGLPAAVLWASALLGLALPWDRHRPRQGASALAFWGLLYVSAYTVYRIDLYQWYLTPVLVPMSVLGVYGLHRVTEALATPGMPVVAAVLRHALVVAVVAPVVVLQAESLAREVRATVSWTETVERSRADAADWILARGTPDDVICTGAIGIVGWRTGMFVWDSLGLVTRGAAGANLDQSLRHSNAEWLITEVATGAEYPSIFGFRLSGALSRGGPVTFLVYQRAPGVKQEASDDVVWAEPQVELSIGLVLERVELTERRLEVTLKALRPVATNPKIFVHIYRPGGGSGRPSRLADYYPTTPASTMDVGRSYTSVTHFLDPLAPGSVVKLGLFAEDRPGLPRFATRDGVSELHLVYAPE